MSAKDKAIGVTFSLVMMLSAFVMLNDEVNTVMHCSPSERLVKVKARWVGSSGYAIEVHDCDVLTDCHWRRISFHGLDEGDEMKKVCGGGR